MQRRLRCGNHRFFAKIWDTLPGSESPFRGNQAMDELHGRRMGHIEAHAV